VTLPRDHSNKPEPNRQALWFGPPHRRLFGWLHLPESGMAGVGVVLCPSLSVEAASAGPALRRLADLLAAAGMAAFRFDYDGTGDSAGSNDDPDRVAAWTGSVSEAVGFVRGLGLRVAVVGLRVGGTLAAAALDRATPPVEGLVLWDPCPSGRTFLREQQMLASRIVHGSRPDDGSVEAPGMVFAPQTVTDLRQLRIDRTTGPLASQVLVLTRRDRPVDQGMSDRLSRAHVSWDVVDGQNTLVDVEPIAAKVHEADLDRIVACLAALPHAPPRTVGRVHDDRAIVGTDDRGRPIVERPAMLAGGRIFAMVTEPGVGDDLEMGNSDGPVVVFLNAGVLDHIGPARLWVNWSRRWAGLGLRCARVDLPGIGESPAETVWSDPRPLAPSVADDIDQVLSDLTAGNPSNTVLVGLCSGAFHSIHAARRHNVRAICMINPSHYMTLKEVGRPGGLPLSRSKDRVTIATQSRVQCLRVPAFLSRVVERLPSSAWWVLNRIADVDAPSLALRDATNRGTLVFVAVNEPGARLLRRGGETALARAVRRRMLTIEVVDDIDHTLFGQASRDQVNELLTSYIAAHFAASGR